MTTRHEIDPVVGDWDGAVTRYREQAVEAYTVLRGRVRKIATETLRQRDRWATSPIDGAVARAVAYQSVAGDLIRALDAVDRICHPLTETPGSDLVEPPQLIEFTSPNHPLTAAEHAVIQQAGDLWNSICAAIPDGPTRAADLRELIVHVHAIQHAFMANAAARRYPDLYRALGATLAIDVDRPEDR